MLCWQRLIAKRLGEQGCVTTLGWVPVVPSLGSVPLADWVMRAVERNCSGAVSHAIASNSVSYFEEIDL